MNCRAFACVGKFVFALGQIQEQHGAAKQNSGRTPQCDNRRRKFMKLTLGMGAGLLAAWL